jgi:hypothetical protein
MSLFFFQKAAAPQLFANLMTGASHLPFPNFLKDLVRKGDITNFRKIEDFFDLELPNLSVQDDQTAEYFLFISEQALLYYFYKHQYDAFNQALEISRHRLVALKSNRMLGLDFEGFEAFLELLDGAFQRLMKFISIEYFEENFLNKIDWSVLDPASIGPVSSLIGYVYLNEEQTEQVGKARLWLSKSMQEGTAIDNVANVLFMKDYFLRHGNGDAQEQIRRLAAQIESSYDTVENQAQKSVLKGVSLILEASQLDMDEHHYDEQQARLAAYHQRVRDFELKVGKEDTIPFCVQLPLGTLIGRHYASLYPFAEDELEQSGFAKRSHQRFEQVLQLAEGGYDEKSIFDFRLQKAANAIETDMPQTEKDLKEVLTYFRKNNDYQAYVNTTGVYLKLLEKDDDGNKALDLIQDIFKQGSKKQDQGGFFLTYSALKLANETYLPETRKPGVSWIVSSLADFFVNVQEAIDNLESQLDLIGKSLVESFREAFLEFEPVSHFNFIVYLRYQLYEIKLMRIGAIQSNDKISLRLADRLLKEMTDENNPLSFIQAQWEEFKNVPNSVRNKTLNKCINISKGDLPLAAQHLDFSYRNLRSYITFKEVNRLGFFLDMQLTSNKQLEQGIRLMFFDLYKSGTIFEVVFDMPKFLVNHANSGFFSSDLEEELKIKGTTAKKYIKIMIEIGLIRQDKVAGRKHFYAVVQENIMKRLGKDQATLIK